jgi:hypothetical protein
VSAYPRIGVCEVRFVLFGPSEPTSFLTTFDVRAILRHSETPTRRSVSPERRHADPFLPSSDKIGIEIINTLNDLAAGNKVQVVVDTGTDVVDPNNVDQILKNKARPSR